MSVSLPDRPSPLREASLEDRWRSDAAAAMMNGVQAAIRALFDELRSDRAAGRRTAGFVSGYQGSPLGTLDQELARRRRDLDELSITFQPGLNEELAATAVWGSQLAYLTPDATVEGVLGLWYGKNPGLDRAADALRHANLSGVGPAGGAVALVGDDPACKSSTLPSACERTLAAMMVPVFAPASVQDVHRLTRHAYRMSRAAGAWAAVKLVADLADASSIVGFDTEPAEVPRLVALTPTARLLGSASLVPERHLLEQRLPAVLEYARRTDLNLVHGAGAGARLGVVAAGATYAELLRGLEALDLDPAGLDRLGLRVLKLDLVWPLDTERVRTFADGLQAVLVIEDKLPFLETEVKAALLGLERPPAVLGKHDVSGARLLPAHAAVRADDVAGVLARLLDLDPSPGSRPQLPVHQSAPAMDARGGQVLRTPYFCSGCPHNTSTRADTDALVGAGIGCHVMLVQQVDGRSGQILGLTQMGGEGAQWIGMAPFTQRSHFTQNVGDGTFHHSASLAVRAAVAAGVNITYKLLYNDAVAMTGGQRVPGLLSVPDLTRLLAAEGVASTVVTTDEPSRYRGLELAANASVRPREQLSDVARELARIPGVTVIVHDQQCAAERRRLRKRGQQSTPAHRVWINERVCEGCGDCGEKSGCLSVVPTQTPFGRKTRIDTPSCNLDFSCLSGDCPSFLTVRPAARERRRLAPPALPAPPATLPASASVRMVGIGGTGVLTVSQVLAMAAHVDGRFASTVDQTGLSQKAGPVVSDARIGPRPSFASARASAESVDVLLAFDLLGSARPDVQESLSAERTVAVISSSIASTGQMVTDASLEPPDVGLLLGAVAAHCRRVEAVLDVHAISERLFGDPLPANILLLGVAWQAGLLPVSWDALVRAIELNGTAATTNLDALAWGRVLGADPSLARELLEPPGRPEPIPQWIVEALDHMRLPSVRARELAGVRAADLAGWGGRSAARRYLAALERVGRIECECAPGRSEITEAVAASLHHLLAYKDEYEVARLHLLPEERARREAEFGPGARVWVHLHPPILRALGLRRKLRFGRSAPPLLRILRGLRFLRGTPLDIFGYAELRRIERALPGEYLAAVHALLDRLDEATYDRAVALCASPEMVRGYEQIKLANVAAWRERVREITAAPRQAP